MNRNKRGFAISEDIKLVLGILNMRYPNYVPGDTIYRAILGVSTNYTKTRLRRDLSYLNEDGFVKFRGLHGIEALTLSVNDCAFALSANGFELANGLTKDEAIGPMPDLEE